MKITESRANDILHWLDDETGNHALLFEKMTLHRDAAALIRQLQAEVQDAWQAGLDEGRAQARNNRLAEPQPVAWQFQDHEGNWRDFIDERHRLNTLKDGSWPIRALYDHPSPSVPVDGADRDDARRYRALVATGKYVPAMQGWGLACSRSKASKAELDAAAGALASQPGGSDNDR